ncbi:MAG: S8 family serine peptidase [Planctomycetota bacterium]
MQATTLTRPLFATLLFGSLLAQSDPSLAPLLPNHSEHGVPGAVAGTERWIVHFARRSFDLSGFRGAIAAHRPAAEVAAIVADLEQRVIADQAPFAQAVQALGGTVVRQWWIVDAAAVEIAPNQLLALRRLPNIAYLQPDERCEPVILTATNSSNHDADSLQALGFKGQGVAVAVVDTGQDANMNGFGRPHRVYFPGGNVGNTTGAGIGGSRLLVNRQFGTLPADDPHGHGTGVASICAGADWGTAGADDGHAPEAGICGYSLSNNTAGTTTQSVMASAWQQVAADRATYNIVSANMSYSDSPNPLDISQQAIDSAALNADIMCCVAAANNGSSTAVSCGAANTLAVGAVTANSHTVATFSSRGPLSGDPGRFYPDIAACGVNTVMALRDNENGDYVTSGTSMASPQVCGAAAQLRARFPALSAVETKAALLASAVDISLQNPGLDRNAFGMGLLRNDRVHDLVAAGNYGSSTVGLAAPVVITAFPVIVGHSYRAAIAWHRLDVNSTAWSNLDLEVLDPGSAVIGQSTTPRNLYELAEFTANFTGTVTLRVTAQTIGTGTSQPFAWSATEIPPIPVHGTAVSFGRGCGPVCDVLNGPGTLVPVALSGEFAFDMVAAAPMTLSAIDVFTRSQLAGTASSVVTVYLPSGGIISQTHLAVTAAAVGTSPDYYRATFTSPVTIPAGPYWIGIYSPPQTTAFPNVATGTAVGGYQRTTPLNGPWTRSSLMVRPSFRLYCENPAGVGVPLLSVVGTPRTGSTVGLDLSAALPSSAAFLGVGLSATTAPFGPLPYSLEPFGAIGCAVLTSGDSQRLYLVDAAGTAHAGLVVPNDPTLVNLQLYAQYFVAHPAANQLGIVATGGWHLSLGN